MNGFQDVNDVAHASRHFEMAWFGVFNRYLMSMNLYADVNERQIRDRRRDLVESQSQFGLDCALDSEVEPYIKREFFESLFQQVTDREELQRIATECK